MTYDIIPMESVRKTVLVNEFLAEKIEQEFGNFNKGINIIIQRHAEENKPKSMWGAFKELPLMETLEDIRKKERKNRLKEEWHL